MDANQAGKKQALIVDGFIERVASFGATREQLGGKVE
jgi:hypothetical protein